MTSQYSIEHNGRATDEHEGILEQIADLNALPRSGNVAMHAVRGTSQIEVFSPH